MECQIVQVPVQIAVLRETEGQGPYCSLVMAVVVVKDVLVFVMFATNLEVASSVSHPSPDPLTPDPLGRQWRAGPREHRCTSQQKAGRSRLVVSSGSEEPSTFGKMPPGVMHQEVNFPGFNEDDPRAQEGVKG